MKYPWLYVGAKVVCVGLSPDDLLPIRLYEPGKGSPLVRNGVYTVRDIVMQLGHPFIRLEELRLPGGFLEPVADARGFRPVLPDTSDQVEALKKLVEPSRLPAKVDA